MDALNYFSRVGNISEENKLIINNFIIQLKDNNLWDSLLEAWLLSEEYNIGSGSKVTSLINPTNEGTLLGTISPTWENTGIRFYEGYIRPNFNTSRMEIQNWIYPPQRAPMSIACVYTPFSSPKPGGDPSPVLGPGACLFGQTSLGGGAFQHFGINYGFALSAVDGYYGSNTIENGTFMFNITGGPNGPYYMSSMIAASGGPAYFYTNDKSHLFTSNYNSNAALSAVAFSYSMGGVTVNQEFDGIICAGFVFSSSINYSKFYSIYKSTIGQNITFAGYP
jgi:hypothetical protein